MNILNETKVETLLLPAKDRSIGIVGLGYVGLPVAVEFGMNKQVVGFDINENRLKELREGMDFTNEVESEYLQKSDVMFTNEINKLSECDFIIVAVPTPVDESNKPDLTPLLKASETVGKALKKGTIVVYESTVYPGATEEDCVPVLEKVSGLKCGEDFYVGYSPERINPGDKVHTFKTITKVVSGQTPEVLDIVAEIYETVVEAGVHKAPSIKVAEAAKVIENTQRDVNIALMNELAIIFEKMDINTMDVLEASGTKWNFLNFKPGLVGGHCIGVDPYYLTSKASKLGYHAQMITSGRRINDGMSEFIVNKCIKLMIENDLKIKNQNITILGATFKENVPDIRNSKVFDVVKEFEKVGMKVQLHDVHADELEVKQEYGVDLMKLKNIEKSQVLVLATPHDEYRENLEMYLNHLMDNSKINVIIDLKGLVDCNKLTDQTIYWSL